MRSALQTGRVRFPAGLPLHTPRAAPSPLFASLQAGGVLAPLLAPGVRPVAGAECGGPEVGMRAITTKTWRKLKLKKHKIRKRRRLNRSSRGK
ncbi:hypothetical protein HYH03_005268 [Edaphochlamys debaryana]|uniref:Mitochondrial mRNA-processing protein COX24 C-terminal domain-containing protein n=1 Tax=Edaphochlamys debaryana TaxID=47281 RepID=A0A835Y8C4_9CHLO|nr:hypothetical protein HYH03_005268 [Edaphochlamys debaryana]|eukprot:KAG2496867.1 hypothetical protein HYH03_005268 [Edaphochlamys debaryana]